MHHLGLGPLRFVLHKLTLPVPAREKPCGALGGDKDVLGSDGLDIVKIQ